MWFFEMPALTYPLIPMHTYATLGRPRVLTDGTNEWLDMDQRVPAMTSHQTDIRDRRPIRGGVTWPTRLVTQHTAQGFFWRVFHGHLMAQTTTFSYTSGGNPVSLTNVSGWPIPPTLLYFGPGSGSLHYVINNVTPPNVNLQGAWPWEMAGSPAPAPLPMMAPLPEIDLGENLAFERLRGRIPNIEQWREDRLNNLRSWPLPDDTLRTQDEWRKRLYVLPEFEERMDREVERISSRRDSGGGGIVPLTP
jgi:hypothetical protein